MDDFVSLEHYRYDTNEYRYRGKNDGEDVFPGKIVEVKGLDGIVFKNLQVHYLDNPENGLVQIMLQKDLETDPDAHWIGRPLNESDLRILRFDLSNLD